MNSRQKQVLRGASVAGAIILGFGISGVTWAQVGAEKSAPQKVGGIAIASEVGTTGIGAHMVIPLQPAWQLRLGFGHVGYAVSGSTSSVGYDLRLKARTYDALLDWHPDPEKSFRVTAGIAFNGSKIAARARPDSNGVYTLQGREYQAAQVGTVTGNVDFNNWAPYLGLGWSTGQREKGWSVSSDVGVLFQGKPHTTLSSSGCTAGAATCAQFGADVRRESAALNDAASKFQLYPVLRIGVNYRF